ncbi:MAG: thiol-activated cytolysin family protein [Candidatus Cyclobacteriaceae bacterium M3_2C_046]
MKNIQQTSQVLAYLIIPFIILVSCSEEMGEDAGLTENDKQAINTNFENLETFSQPAENPTPEEVDTSQPERDQKDNTLECYTTTFKASPGFDQMLALDPTTDVIFPGALLQGSSIPTGEYIPIVSDRAPITLSASLTNINGSPVVTVTDPSLSTVREGVKSILDQEITGSTAAKLNFEISQVYSEQHLSVALGANYRSAGQDVSSSFNFAQSAYKNKFVIKYLQIYYTIDVDPPKEPSDFFNSMTVLEELNGTLPVYVSSVFYGRMVLYTVESNYEFTEINAAFSASFTSGGGTIDANYSEIISNSTIKALVIGGSGKDAAKSIDGPGEVYDYIANGGEYSKDSPGAPISYKLRFLTKGTPVARVVMATEYNIRQCDLAYPIFNIKLNKIKLADSNDAGGNTDLYGYVGGRLSLDGTWVKNGNDVLDVYWGRNEGSPLNFKGTHQVNDEINIEVYKPDYEKDYIQLYGKLYDKDFLEDDYLGNRTFEVKLRNLQLNQPYLVNNKDEPKLIFDEQSGQKVEVYFSITRIK